MAVSKIVPQAKTTTKLKCPASLRMFYLPEIKKQHPEKLRSF